MNIIIDTNRDFFVRVQCPHEGAKLVAIESIEVDENGCYVANPAKSVIRGKVVESEDE